MAFDLKKDWLIVAAGGAAIVGAIVVAKGGGGVTNVPVKTGTSSADYQAALAAQVSLSQATLQAKTALAGGLINAYVENQKIESANKANDLEFKAKMAEINMQGAAIQGQLRNQSQANLFGLLGGIAPLLFGLFCEDETNRAIVARRIAGGRHRLRALSPAYAH